MRGVSDKEMKVISFLELNEKFFFTRDDIRNFFRNDNEMNVYIHRLRKKGRIVKLNRSKYYLIPVKAYKGHWSEHPFIIVDEIFNGKDYYIGGMAAAHHWGIIEQIPTQIEVCCTRKQGQKELFGFALIFKRVRPESMKNFVKREIMGHAFCIASKKKVELWLKSR